MQNMKRPVSRAGFTLLELLVVIAIISLLAAILLPAFGNFRRRARMVQCTANLKGIGQAGTSFASANKDAITDIGKSAYNIPGWDQAFSPSTSVGAWPGDPKEYNWIGLDGEVKRPLPSGPKLAIGMGCLYVDNYLASAASYYCPMNEFGLTTKETFNEKLEDGTIVGGYNGFCRDHAQTEFTSAGYTYNPHNYLTKNGKRSYRNHNDDAKKVSTPGSQYSPSEAVWAMDILSSNFYSKYKIFNHSKPKEPDELEDDDVSFNLLHMDGGVSNNVISRTLQSDALSGSVRFDYPSWDNYIREMIHAAKSD